MYDPDPRIYREGWKMLRDAGVYVRDFDAALREEIKMDNREFVGQFQHAVGLEGRARFDYTLNDGQFRLYVDASLEVSFSTRWVTAGHGVVYAYDAVNNVGDARYATEFAEIDDPGAYEFDTYARGVHEGEVSSSSATTTATP